MKYDYMQTTRPEGIDASWEFVTMITADNTWNVIWIFRKEHVDRNYVS